MGPWSLSAYQNAGICIPDRLTYPHFRFARHMRGQVQLRAHGLRIEKSNCATTETVRQSVLRSSFIIRILNVEKEEMQLMHTRSALARQTLLSGARTRWAFLPIPLGGGTLWDVVLGIVSFYV